MTVIFYRDRLCAVVDGAVAFQPHIEVLEPDHPRRRFVSLLAVYAIEIQQGALPGPFRETEAAHYARCQLMPAQLVWPLLGLDDAVLAERFNLPLEQVPYRRGDLAGYRPAGAGPAAL